MSKKSKPSQSFKTTGKERTAAQIKPTWFDKDMPGWKTFLLAAAAIYLFTLLIFPSIIFNHYDFNFGGDNLAAAPVVKMGDDFRQQGSIPGWCPYIFAGMPMVGSLLYANHCYFAFNEPFQSLFSLLFLGTKFGWLFFHLLLAGIGVYLLLRHLQVHWTISALCGILFAFNPPMVVFADVGHGSKLMGIAYLPWVLYFTRRVFEQPKPFWAALLALAFGLQLLALHVQIAYYGAMMMGLYVVYAFIVGGKSDLKKNLTATAYMAAAGMIGFAIAAPLYLQVQEYSQFSIRGGGSTGGAAWDYATAWSFHPLESLTYIFPSFYGFGGETYWGHMPFTDMPLYWGGLVLLLAPWALVLKRDRTTTFLLVLAALAWIVSFGNFLPILYKPLYALLPYFNKFRVPSLMQVLVFLPMVILAGIAFQAIWEIARQGGEKAAALGRKFMMVGAIAAGFCLLLFVLQAALRPIWSGWVADMRPQWQGQGAGAAFDLFTGDLGRLLLMIILIYGAAVLVLLKNAPRWLLIAGAAIAVVFELNHLDKKLIHPTSPEVLQDYLAADDVVKFLQKDPEPYRIFPLTQSRNPDWYLVHRLESISGYTGAKTRLIQEAMDSLTFNNPALLSLLNTRYFISDRAFNHPDLQEVYANAKQKVYRFLPGLPRAFLVGKAVAVASASEIFSILRAGNFDVSQAALLEKPLAQSLDEQATGSVNWKQRTPDHLSLDIETSGNQLLVLSELYYPSGWKALLDGQPVEIYKTNFLLRGVLIPSGKHHLEMSFKPESMGKGNLLKWAGIVLILAGLTIGLLQKRRNKDITAA
ncbi:MAG: YfhO family protein [bacterium]|nr:YfhO family protein [bacterium]